MKFRPRSKQLQDELERAASASRPLRQELAAASSPASWTSVPQVAGVPVLAALLPNADADTLRAMTDRFRQRYPAGWWCWLQRTR
jgi:ribosomal protein S12 methylthiotransferase accessory factor YcaO